MLTLIFDLDNTLIPWIDDYVNILHNATKKYGFNKDKTKIVMDLVDEAENTNKVLSKEELLKFINQKLAMNLPISFIEDYIDAVSMCVTSEKGVVDTIKYLSNKYKLYVVTNWFTDSQTKRLEKLGIAKYFTKIIGADINYLKPNPKAFDIILKDNDSKNCISIGDSLKKDILIAKEKGMHVIWKTNEESKEFTTIKNIEELKDILEDYNG